MLIVVDAMCAEYGGIRTYVEHLLGQWERSFPEDELHVLVPESSDLDTAGHQRVDLAIGRPATLGRPLAQTRAIRDVGRRLRPDAVLATVPSTTLLRTEAPMGVVILDLRHELRPDQFTWFRRLLRRVSYGRTYAIADGFVSISHRSLEDLHALHGRTREVPAVVTHLGGDHVLDWPEPSRGGPAIAFAHHTNKNPDLILEAWELLVRRGGDVPALMIIGVRGPQRAQLIDRIERGGLSATVSLAPFLPEAEFHKTIVEADMIVFPSDFEGFGLPVVEGMILGKPVVIGPEKATMEVAHGHAVVMDDWSVDALADAVLTARGLSEGRIAAAEDWGRTFTWDRTVRQTREALLGLRRNCH
jgi:glycosyltransferase involved in cell wall biosynthesis